MISYIYWARLQIKRLVVGTSLSAQRLGSNPHVSTHRLEAVVMPKASGSGIGQHGVSVFIGALQADGLESILGLLDTLFEGHPVQEELLASLFKLPALSLDDLFHLVELLELDLKLLQGH